MVSSIYVPYMTDIWIIPSHTDSIDQLRVNWDYRLPLHHIFVSTHPLCMRPPVNTAAEIRLTKIIVDKKLTFKALFSLYTEWTDMFSLRKLSLWVDSYCWKSHPGSRHEVSDPDS